MLLLVEVAEPRRLPVPEIICQEPPDEDDSFRWRILPGTGTATGEVLFEGNGDLDPILDESLFDDE